MTLDMPIPHRLAMLPISESMRPLTEFTAKPMSASVIYRTAGEDGSTAEQPLAIPASEPLTGTVQRHPEHYVLRFLSTAGPALTRHLNHARLSWHEFTFEKQTKRGHSVTRSWLPGYRFLHVDIRRDFWQAVYTMPGVISVLGQPRPTPIGAETMAHLHATLNAPLPVVTAYRAILPGTLVRIRGGMCDGIEGRVTYSYRRSVDVLGFMFNRPVTVNARLQDVEVIPDAD